MSSNLYTQVFIPNIWHFLLDMSKRKHNMWEMGPAASMSSP